MVIESGIAVLIALLAWWAGTIAILYLDGLERRTHRGSMLLATALLSLALYGIAAVANDLSIAGAYIGFACGILVWAWLELTFLFGFVVGPRRIACAQPCKGFRHFVHAIEALLYHELLLAAAVAAVCALSWRAANQTGLYTVLVLWGMRESAKLNLFLGVRNTNSDWLPRQLAYLSAFFKQRRMNYLLPISLCAGLILTVGFASRALADSASEFTQVASTLLAALAALGVLEHLLLVLPLNTTKLWWPGFLSRESAP